MATETFDPNAIVRMNVSLDLGAGNSLFGYYTHTPAMTRTYTVAGKTVTKTFAASNSHVLYLTTPNGVVGFLDGSASWDWDNGKAKFLFTDTNGVTCELDYYEDAGGSPLVDVSCPTANVSVTGVKPYGDAGFMNVTIDSGTPGSEQPQQGTGQ